MPFFLRPLFPAQIAKIGKLLALRLRSVFSFNPPHCHPPPWLGTLLTIQLGLTEKNILHLSFIGLVALALLSLLPLLLLASNQYSIDANTIIILLWPFICQYAQQE